MRLMHGELIYIEFLKTNLIVAQSFTGQTLYAVYFSIKGNWFSSKPSHQLKVFVMKLLVHGGAALVLGALGSLLIGGLLMALLFYSSKYGYDEQVFSADDENQWD